MKRLKGSPRQTDVRLNSSTRQLASDPRSQTAEPQNNKCDVAASCPHSILVKRLECCADRLNPPSKADMPGVAEGCPLSAKTDIARQSHCPTAPFFVLAIIAPKHQLCVV